MSDDKRDKRLNLRVSIEDKKMAEAIAKKLNVKMSDAWRIAIKHYYENEIKSDTK